MAANIDTSRGEAFFSLKEPAWHGLGTVVQEAKSSKEVIEIAKLDYIVSKARVYANYIPEGHKLTGMIPQGGYMIHDKHNAAYTIPKKGEIVPNAFVTYREDTHTLLMSGRVVTNRYQIVQNQEAFDWFDGIVDSQNITFETAGALGVGERIFITAKLPNSYRIKGDDSEITKYLLFTNSHDGSGNIQVMFTPTRVVCNNTLSFAIQNATNKFKIKHTKSAKDKLKTALDMLNAYNIYETNNIAFLDNLASKNITVQEAKQIVYPLVFNTEEMANVISNKWDYLGVGEISTMKKNKMSSIMSAIESGVGQNSNRGTAYWLLNGVSNYYQNVKLYEDKEEKFNTIFNGEGARNIELLSSWL